MTTKSGLVAKGPPQWWEIQDLIPAFTAWCFEVGHVARIDTSEGQALWQPGGAEKDSRFREGNRHLRLAYNKEE